MEYLFSCKRREIGENDPRKNITCTFHRTFKTSFSLCNEIDEARRGAKADVFSHENFSHKNPN